MQIIVTQKDDLLTSKELCLSSDISEAILYELVEHNIAVPIEGEHVTQWQFTVSTVTLVKKAARIKYDFSLDWSAIPLILQLLDERDELISENEMLKQHLSRFKYFE
ncbi:chaperone modulatory protein CbpM [Pseudoalteromonas sp. BSi20652]|uniref:chaperone modulator CbpM n=1 Tax=Pseudoalteromonas sp. BSi20652 TaxID=388384 RepID=UPI0002317664|nr:chaperone modulator CbpM [Pseudoalteromonas sp. BSi20652]GAA61653.1 chaperone modulatory protein CbpM [Pseudoalteromonas sp. BSi20652]